MILVFLAFKTVRVSDWSRLTFQLQSQHVDRCVKDNDYRFNKALALFQEAGPVIGTELRQLHKSME